MTPSAVAATRRPEASRSKLARPRSGCSTACRRPASSQAYDVRVPSGVVIAVRRPSASYSHETARPFRARRTSWPRGFHSSTCSVAAPPARVWSEMTTRRARRLRSIEETTVPSTLTDSTRPDASKRPRGLPAGGVGLRRLPPRGVVRGPGGPAQRVGLGDDVVPGVVLAPGHAAERVGDAGDPAGGVVGVAGDPAVAVDDLDELAGGVVAELPSAVPGVAALRDAPGGVVGVAGGARAGLVAGGDPAAHVVLRPGGLAGRQGLLDESPVGVVGVGGAPAGGVDDGGDPAAAVVLVAGGRARGADDLDEPAGRVAARRGQRARGVDVLDRAAAPVVGDQRLGAVGLLGRDQPAETVEAGGGAGQPVVGACGPERPVGVEGTAQPGRVGGRDHLAVLVVVLLPGGAVGRRGGGQPGEGVVGEAPGGAVGQLDRGEVAEVVVVTGDRATQRVDRAGLLAVLAVLHLGAGAGRVDGGREASRGGVLVAPRRAVGVAPAGEQAGDRVVGVRRAGAGGRDRGDDPAAGVALEPRGAAGGVRGGDQVAVLVVGEGDLDADRVDDLGQQPVAPGEQRVAALGVDDGRRVPAAVVLRRVGVLGDRAALGDHGREPVELVVAVGEVGPGRRHRVGAAAAGVVLVHGGGAVALGHHHDVAVGVVAHRLAVLVGVHHADQATAGVVQPGVGAGAVGVGDDRDPARQVGVAGGAPERRALPQDPAVRVVGVVDLDHAVGVDDRADQPGVVPAVGPGAEGAGGTDQLPGVVVGVGDLAAVRGPGRDDARVVPDQLDAAAPLVLQPDQQVRLADEPDRGPRTGREGEQLTGGGVVPPGAVVPGDPEPGRRCAPASCWRRRRGPRPRRAGGRPRPGRRGGPCGRRRR